MSPAGQWAARRGELCSPQAGEGAPELLWALVSVRGQLEQNSLSGVILR